MKTSYLEVTYRNGRPFAAYLYLSGRGRGRSVRTRKAPPGLVIDLGRNGKPLGIEITAPSRVTLAALNRALRSVGADPVTHDDLSPLHAA